MADHLTKKQRSELMSKIRGKDTKPEMMVRSLLWRAGYRYRLHVSKLPGSPDLVFPARKKVIFVNGCFWHGHKCRTNKLPKSRTKYWREKIARNKKRDTSNLRVLKRLGWDCLTIWECEVKKQTLPRKIFTFLDTETKK